MTPSPKHVLYGLALAGSLAITALNRPLGLTTTGTALGFGLAVVTRRDDRTLEQQLERGEAMRERLEAEAGDLHSTVVKLGKDKKSLTNRAVRSEKLVETLRCQIASVQIEYRKLESGDELNAIKARHKTEISKLSAQINKQSATHLESLTALELELSKASARNKRGNEDKLKRVRELRKTITELDERLVSQASEHATELHEMRSRYEADRKAQQAEFEAVQKDVISHVDSFEQRFAAVCKKADEATGELMVEREELAGQVNQLATQLSTPERFGGIGKADCAGNALLDFLTGEGILMRAVETDPSPDNGLLIRLKPVNAVALADVQKLMPKLEVALKLYALPTADFKNGLFSFRCYIDAAPKKGEPAPLRSNLEKLEKAIDLANHLRILGTSGSGKSVFLDNAIWFGKCLWPDSKLDILDPKYPFTEWSDLVPTHKGAEATVDGVIEISAAMEKRLEVATVEVDKGNAIPDFSRYIFAIDEAPVAYTKAKQLDRNVRKGDKLAAGFGDATSDLLRLGRALNVKGYFLTQTHLVSKVGLNDGDWDNACWIYLNAKIDEALKGELKEFFDDDRLSVIAKELERRKAQGQSYLGMVADINRDEIFLFESPRPGFYRDRYQAENDDTLSRSETPFHTSTVKTVKQCEPLQDAAVEDCAKSVTAEAAVGHHTPDHTAITPPRAKCPKCSEGSANLLSKALSKSGKMRFKCDNETCKAKTFSAVPE